VIIECPHCSSEFGADMSTHADDTGFCCPDCGERILSQGDGNLVISQVSDADIPTSPTALTCRHCRQTFDPTETQSTYNGDVWEYACPHCDRSTFGPELIGFNPTD
jgi:Zn finger protein HypA/HybF involved in hydrogenase expression